MQLYLRKSSLWRLTPWLPQGKRVKFTIPGHKTPLNRHMAKNSRKKKRTWCLMWVSNHMPITIYIVPLSFFNYMTFVENIFNSYQGGPYSPTVHITPKWECESEENPDFEAKLRGVNSAAWSQIRGAFARKQENLSFFFFFFLIRAMKNNSGFPG